MTTQEFTNLLKENARLDLRFELDEGKFIEPTYHITEIKNATIDSVDCGGNRDAYNHTVVQLWVNPNEKFRKPWTSEKALSIFQKVDSAVPLDQDAELFFEYGDADIRTSHFSVEDVHIENNTINIQLFTKATVCKPRLKAGAEVSCC